MVEMAHGRPPLAAGAATGLGARLPPVRHRVRVRWSSLEGWHGVKAAT